MSAITGSLNSSEEVSVKVIEGLASEVVQRGLTAPAIFILEMYRPLASVLTSLAIISYPLLIPLFGSGKYSAITQVLKSPPALEKLVSTLETMSAQKEFSRERY